MRSAKIVIYDPLKGNDYSFTDHKTKETFSSIKECVYVVDVVGDYQWENKHMLIRECITKTSTKAFFSIIPWAPGVKKLSIDMKSYFTDIRIQEGSVSGYMSNISEDLKKLFDIRNQHGGGNSGEWCVGGSRDDFDKHVGKEKIDTWDFVSLIRQIDKIGCLLHLGEMQQSTLIVRPFGGLDAILRGLDN